MLMRLLLAVTIALAPLKSATAATYDWSTTAASNASADPAINWQEGMLPSLVNDSARAMMAALKAQIRDAGGAAVLGGVGDAFELTLSQSMVSRQPAIIGFVATRSNTGAVSLKVDATAAAPLRQKSGVDLGAGKIIIGAFYTATWAQGSGEYLLSGPLSLGYADFPTISDKRVIGNFSGATAAPSSVSMAQLAPSVAEAIPADTITNTQIARGPAATVKGTLTAAPSATSAVTVTVASPGVFTWTAHGLADNAGVILTTTGALPTGLAQNVVYYVVASTKTANTFTLSTVPGGASINTTGTQSGVHTATVYPPSPVRDIPLDYIGPLITDSIILPSIASGTTITNSAGTPDTSLAVTARSVTISNATGNVRRASVSLTINATTGGANGLDTGALASNTWYYVYLIDNGATMAGLVSLSATAPTLPSGYKYALRIGAARTDGTASFYRFIQTGNRWGFDVRASGTTTRLPAVVNTSTGDVTTPTYTAFSARANSGSFPTGLAPLTARSIILSSGVAYGGSGAVLIAPNGNYGNYLSTTNPPPLMSTTYSFSPSEIALESNSIYIASNAGASTVVSCIGFIDTASVI